MELFFSAGEPSGDLHSASLMRELRRRRPDLIFSGFGGPHMAAAGCRLLFPLADFPVIGFLPILRQLGRFLALYRQARRRFAQHRPDAVVLVDYPGFNWWLARAAHECGIPVYYFLPPQIWAWATWRVKKMRRFVDHVLCSLPFEQAWYHARGVRAVFTGHPYFDELRAERVDEQFIATHRSRWDSPAVAILPGSRAAEVRRIFPAYLEVAGHIARALPQTRFLVACLRDDHLRLIAPLLEHCPLHIQAYVGKTSEIIRCAQVCLSKSGSVSLELMYHGKPSTILYQVKLIDYWFYRVVRACGIAPAPFITLVNILAGEEIFPEYVRCRNLSILADHALNWMCSAAARHRIEAKLESLNAKVSQPGTTARTADYILQTLPAAKRAA